MTGLDPVIFCHREDARVEHGHDEKLEATDVTFLVVALPNAISYFSKATMRQAVLPWKTGYLTFALQALRARFFA
jgi:hypothetical protein